MNRKKFMIVIKFLKKLQFIPLKSGMWMECNFLKVYLFTLLLSKIVEIVKCQSSKKYAITFAIAAMLAVCVYFFFTVC